MMEHLPPLYWIQQALTLVLPACCPGCSKPLWDANQPICLQCICSLPRTSYFRQPDNPVERLFWGRTNIRRAGSLFFFTRGSSMQRILHALKYGGNQPVGMKLGKMLGEILRTTDRFHPLDGIIPLPLHPKRLRQRGYNQSACIAQGCSIVTGLPVWDGWIYRDKMTETQTRKNRMARWQNLTGGFRMVKPSSVQGKHLLLLDDVVTTGASLEACAMALLAANPASVSIATIAYATQ